MNTVIQAMLIFLFSISPVLPIHATDSAREQRWARQISDFMVEGEALWLKADKQKFLGIYTTSISQKPIGAVIFLHGRGLHPDWPQVIQPLRTRLPDRGWSTLSLQMPVLENDASDEDYLALFKEVPARIQAGLDFLSKQNVNNIVLIGHGLGTNMATDYLARHHDPRIKAFVGISMMGKHQSSEYLPLDNVTSLLQMKVPVLNIYGSQTPPDRQESVDRLAFAVAVYQTDNHYSNQIKINGADQFFQGYEDALAQTISNWMFEFSRLKQSG